MKKRINLKLLVLAVGLLVLPACTKDFEEINTNPNVPNTVTPDLLLPNIIRNSANQVTNESWGIGNIVVQHTAKIQFVNEDRYLWGEQNGVWNTMYNTLRDVNNMYKFASQANPVQKNYQAIALIMRSWIFSVLTDAYGDVPYSEAIKGKEKVYFPKYDKQEDIYAGILAELKEANTLLSTANEPVRGDILFDGNINKWKKLANSLQLRYQMRISNKRNVAADMQAILANPAATPIFESNADNAALKYLSAPPNNFPLYNSRIGSLNEFRLSKTLGDKLTSLNDSRLTVFARPTVASVTAGNPQYVGVPNGLDDVAALEYNGGTQNISRVGEAYYIDGFGTPSDRELNIAKGIIMNYAELQFILAEAAHKGLISTGIAANEYYERGIVASFDYYGLTVPAGYLVRPGVAFEAGKELELIGTQKWISLFYSGLEAWFDWRRSGFPNLQPGPSNLNNNKIPVRYLYPGNEFTLNSSAVTEAINRQGPNDINTPVWWDK